MKTIGVVVVLWCLCATLQAQTPAPTPAAQAPAANLPVPTYTAPLAIYSWTGCYIGGTIGEASARQNANEHTLPPAFVVAGPGSISYSNSGLIGGAHAGCNVEGTYGLARNWIFGIEADWSGTKLGGTQLAPNVTPGGAPIGSGSIASKFGWVAGGGVEWAPWDSNWLLRAEALYYKISGDSPYGIETSTGNTTTSWYWNDLAVIDTRVGLSYKFGDSAIKPARAAELRDILAYAGGRVPSYPNDWDKRI